VQLGHAVTVLTAMPSYPQGRVFDGYRGHLVLAELAHRIRIVRTWVYATKSKRLLPRLLNYCSFAFSSLVIGTFKVGPQDVVIVESPPLFLGFSGFLMSRLAGAKLIFNVSDLWPESAVAMGILRNKLFIGLSKWLEEFVYRRSDLITGQTQGIVDNIRSRFPGKRVELITNGVDVEAFRLDTQAEQIENAKKEFGTEGKCVVGYAGLHGLAQGLDTALQAAQLLRGYPDLLFALFGDGPEKEQLVRRADENQLANVRFYPSQHASRMPAVLASFDIALVPLRRLDLFKGALPSKMFEAMAAAVPLVVSVEGEACVLTTNARAGICIEPENPGAMADAILDLYQRPVFRKSLGRNGQQYVMEHYNRQRIGEKFERLIVDVHLAVS
jgi:glycosyltransferase involved in cell wall biosynthesis